MYMYTIDFINTEQECFGDTLSWQDMMYYSMVQQVEKHIQ